MTITTIVEQARSAAAEYLALPSDQRPAPDNAVRFFWAALFTREDDVLPTEAQFPQFELAFGLVVTAAGA